MNPADNNKSGELRSFNLDYYNLFQFVFYEKTARYLGDFNF
jgi:hypothetical protein